MKQQMWTIPIVVICCGTIVLAAGYNDDTKNTVLMVKQQFIKGTQNMLKNQVEHHQNAGYAYQAYSSYFQRADVSLPGTQKFFAEAAEKKREQAQTFIDYINKRGGHVEFRPLNFMALCKKQILKNCHLCTCSYWSSTSSRNCQEGTDGDDWKDALNALEDALKIELFLQEQLLELHKGKKEKDGHLRHVLEKVFLADQIDAIYEIGQHISRLKNFPEENYKLGEYVFDQALK